MKGKGEKARKASSGKVKPRSSSTGGSTAGGSSSAGGGFSGKESLSESGASASKQPVAESAAAAEPEAVEPEAVQTQQAYEPGAVSATAVEAPPTVTTEAKPAPKTATGSASAKSASAGGAGAAAASASAVAEKPQQSSGQASASEYPPMENKKLWATEYHEHHGEQVPLANGDVLVVGEKHNAPEYKVYDGKKLKHSTSGYYFGGGLGNVAYVAEDKDDPNITYAVMKYGQVAAYDSKNKVAGGKLSSTEVNTYGMSQAQAAAVMAADHKEAKGKSDALSEQYENAWADYAFTKGTPALVKAADAHYVYSKNKGETIQFSDPEMEKKATAYAKANQTKKNAAAGTGAFKDAGSPISGGTASQEAASQEAASGAQATPTSGKSSAVKTKSAPGEAPATGKPFDPEKYGGHFDTLSEVNDYCKTANAQWSKSLTDTEKGAVSSYKGSGYGPLNRALRQGKASSAQKEQAKNIDAAMAKAPRLAEPMVVYRGRMPDSVCKAFATGEQQSLVGSVVSDDGFTSTSFDRGVAKNFSHSSKHAPSVGRITVPAGTRASYLESISSMNEAEMCLPRSTKMVITNVYEENGTNYVDATIFSQQD